MRAMRGELHEKSGQPIKGFVCHVDDKKAVKGFKRDQNRTMIRFHQGYSVGKVEDGLETANPKARREVQWLLQKFRKENKHGSETKKV